MLRTVPPEVARSGTETCLTRMSVQLLSLPLLSIAGKIQHTESDGKVEDETSTEHLLQRSVTVHSLSSFWAAVVGARGRWVLRGRAGPRRRLNGLKRTPVMGLIGIVEVVVWVY